MRIKELLTDDDLYELAVLITEIQWQALMAQRLATNPKIDPLKGFNARLDNTNVFPVITDKEAEIEKKRKW